MGLVECCWSAARTGAGLIDFELYSDGSDVECLHIKGGGSLYPPSYETVDRGLHYIRQEGRTVFRFAVEKMAEVSASLLARNGLTGDDLKLFVPHQANKRIIDAAATRMDLPPEKSDDQHRSLRQHHGRDDSHCLSRSG